MKPLTLSTTAIAVDFYSQIKAASPLTQIIYRDGTGYVACRDGKEVRIGVNPEDRVKFDAFFHMGGTFSGTLFVPEAADYGIETEAQSEDLPQPSKTAPLASDIEEDAPSILVSPPRIDGSEMGSDEIDKPVDRPVAPLEGPSVPVNESQSAG